MLRVLPVIVLVVDVLKPSVKLIPVIDEVPNRVMLEKLLFVTVEVAPVAVLPLSVIRVVAPDLPPLL